MADRQGVHRLVYPSTNSLHSDFIDSSSPEFIAIRRKMVSNLVSNGWGASAMGVYPGIVYKPDLRLGFGNRQLGISATTPDLDCFI